MKRIYYSGGAFLTGNSIADAVMAYADALAHNVGSDVINFPVLHDDGSRGEVSVLIGPASLIASSTVVVDFPELLDVELVAELARRSALTGPLRPITQPQNEIETRTDFD